MSTATVAAVPQVTLFERLGGVPAIKAAVDAFYVRVLADQALAPHFEGVNMRWLKGRLPVPEVLAAVQVAMAGGLPYTLLRDMVLAHPTVAEGLGDLFSAVPPGA